MARSKRVYVSVPLTLTGPPPDLTLSPPLGAAAKTDVAPPLTRRVATVAPTSARFRNMTRPAPVTSLSPNRLVPFLQHGRAKCTTP